MSLSKKATLFLFMFFISYCSFAKIIEEKKITDVFIITNVNNVINFKIFIDGKEDEREFKLTLTRDKDNFITHTSLHIKATCKTKTDLTKAQRKYIIDKVLNTVDKVE